MVLLAAAVCNKAGKTLISRQFVEMTRSRIEGLLAAFPKLISSSKQQQHTFIETESVRYVYQPLEKIYMLLITTKKSNILEDLETLRLFVRILPEYCRNVDESEVQEHAFALLFAFDEVVALGYREAVNLAQIRTFVDMDSHDEKVYHAVRLSQEREAKEQMKRKIDEMKKQKALDKSSGISSQKYGGSGYGSGSGGYSGHSSNSHHVPAERYEPVETRSQAPLTGRSGNALKLNNKRRDEDSFVSQLRNEGEHVSSLKTKPAAHVRPVVANDDQVQMKLTETISASIGRDGGVAKPIEVIGTLQLHNTNEKLSRCVVQLEDGDHHGAVMQTHPNIDKRLFGAEQKIANKNAAKGFPLGQDVTVLKWRLNSSDEALLPITLTCWPNDTDSNTCDVSLEFELTRDDLELRDVVISIPLPPGAPNMKVDSCDGEFKQMRHSLDWTILVMNATNRNGSISFSVDGSSDQFYPVSITFHSDKTFCNVQVSSLTNLDDGQPLKFINDVSLVTETYEIA